jgi:GNAT superfamily N-acetyltransferase
MSRRTVKTVVTYLVMTSPPRRLPPQPMGPRLALLRAEDIPLHYYRYLYDAVGRPWLWLERRGMSDEALGAKIRREGVEVWVLYASGVPAGFFELDFESNDSVDLVYFGLMPEWIGRRIGPWLLGEAVSEVFGRGATKLSVNTCTLDHPRALQIYQRLGFEPVAQQERLLKVPEDLAIPAHAEAFSSG